ncbi:MAG: hypothetical protein H6832_10830 [Planctomycetes bacterium]|nr:hypothetical protein [Planctomycetota bacterium]MCB9891115.1 hypothetical protein [Planctomycetota bacterium]MCB9918883.1 hypothetical protein [Planctomycetota bacterium]
MPHKLRLFVPVLALLCVLTATLYWVFSTGRIGTNHTTLTDASQNDATTIAEDKIRESLRAEAGPVGGETEEHREATPSNTEGDTLVVRVLRLGVPLVARVTVVVDQLDDEIEHDERRSPTSRCERPTDPGRGTHGRRREGCRR